ncbi:MAG: MotA/TolQ/ExbB proton channel family protein [bacterium]|nr:MotA/TolQ/ExbB proton channel family protein [bacterium]
METDAGFALESIENIDRRHGRTYDTGVLFGAALGITLILICAISSGHFSKFLDPISLLIVLGGTFAATMIQFSIPEMLQAWGGLKSILYATNDSAIQRIVYLVGLTRKVRKEGLLVLDKEAEEIRDLYLAKALELTVDGQDETIVRRLLETEIRTSIEQRARGIAVFQTMATYAPAFGLIGTLMGLSSLLGSLDSPESVGPAMSVAFMTTLYGALLANLVFLPVAGKMRIRSEEDTLLKTITIEGVIAIAKQENPIIVEQKLQSYLPSIN